MGNIPQLSEVMDMQKHPFWEEFFGNEKQLEDEEDYKKPTLVYYDGEVEVWDLGEVEIMGRKLLKRLSGTVFMLEDGIFLYDFEKDEIVLLIPSDGLREYAKYLIENYKLDYDANSVYAVLKSIIQVLKRISCGGLAIYNINGIGLIDEEGLHHP